MTLSVLATVGVVGATFAFVHDEGGELHIPPQWFGVATGLALGPAVGYLHAGVEDRGFMGIALRTGLLAAGYGAARRTRGLNLTFGMLGLCLAAAGVSGIYDIAVLPKYIEQRYGVRSALTVGPRDRGLALGWTTRF